ncbi:MAG: hypothetical protein WBF43_13115 [Methylocella sp.]
MNRKPGPQKGRGGMPAVPLRDDFPDNMIVAVVLWLYGGRRAISLPFLEMLIYIFDGGDFVETPDEGIGARTMREGVPMVMIGAFVNTRPKRDGVNYPGGKRRQTPDGSTTMKDRVRLIQRKIKKHRPRSIRRKGMVSIAPTPVISKDKLWLGACFAGLGYLLAGQKDLAMVALRFAGWPIFGPAMERLGRFLSMNARQKENKNID